MTGIIEIKPGDIFEEYEAGSGAVCVAHIMGYVREEQQDRYLVHSGDIADPDTAPGDFLKSALDDLKQDALVYQHKKKPAKEEKDFIKSGTTATGAIVTKDHKVHIGHIGDSLALVLAHDQETGEVTIDQLTQDHNYANPHEIDRLIEIGYLPEGSQVSPLQSNVITRGIEGETKNIAPLGADTYPPRDLKPMIEAGHDVYVVVASDGIVDKISLESLRQGMEKHLNSDHKRSVADQLVTLAAKMDSHDNITVLSFKVPEEMDRDVLMLVADGHFKTPRVAEFVRDGMAARAVDYIPESGRDKGPSSPTPSGRLVPG